jgi:flagellar basal-body rod protein FlgB
MDFFGLLFDNSSLPVLGDVMAFTEQRQAVLADDVANSNTPFFRQRDLPVDEFTTALDEAIQHRDVTSPHRYQPRSTRNVSFNPRLSVKTQEIGGLMNYYDGADRSLEHIQNELLKNAIMHETAARLFSHQSQMLTVAIQERV